MRNRRGEVGLGSLVAIMGVVVFLMLIPTAMTLLNRSTQQMPGGLNTTEQGATYIVFRSDIGLYCAKNGTTSTIEFTSINAAHLLQETCDAMTAGGMIFIKEGTIETTARTYFNVTNPDISIVGSGMATELENISVRVLAQDVTISSLQFTGCGWGDRGFISLFTGADGARILNIKASVTQDSNLMIAAFYAEAVDGTLENITFENCMAYDCDSFGWYLNGAGNPRTIKNLWLTNCIAERCGSATSNTWATGFCINEANVLENVYLTNCVADRSWESGFHMEATPDSKNINFLDCTATNNGQKPGAGYGAGFLLSGDCKLTACHSETNANYGFAINNVAVGKNMILQGCYDSGSPVSYDVSGSAGKVTIIDCISENADSAFHTQGSGNIHMDNFYAYDPNGLGSPLMGIYLGNVNYPCTNSDFDIHYVGKTATVAVIGTGMENVTISGSIENYNAAGIGLYLNHLSKNVTVDGLNILCWGDTGLMTYGTQYHCWIRNCHIWDNQTSPTLDYGICGDPQVVIEKQTVSVDGAATKFDSACVFNFNSGKATILSGNSAVTIDHQLYSTPTSITFGAADLELNTTYISAVSATQITFTVITAVTGNADIYWSAWV